MSRGETGDVELFPAAEELRRAYAHRPFSVLAVSRQVKLPGRSACYSTIHSAMIFPVRGRARFALDGDSLTGGRGVVLHGAPNKELVFEAIGDEPFEHVNVYYEACAEPEADPHDWMGRLFGFRPDDYDALLERALALEELSRTPTLENRLNQVVGATNLLRTMFDPSPRSVTDRRMARVRAYLEANYARRISLGDLARLAGMSEERLSYRFWKEFGVRPMSLLISLRLERAMQLLQTDLRVRDVAAAVGYADPLYFSRLFKKHLGISPDKARGTTRRV